MNTYHWLADPHFPHESRQVLYRVEHVAAAVQSEYQEIFIADLVDFGRTLFLDGSPQSSQLDEFIYHESLVQPAMAACPAPRSVFIAGGGEGATLREVLRTKSVERAVMVDIDPLVVALAREHLLSWHQGAFDDPRAQVMHEDARTYLAGTDDKFDVILVDVADPLEGSPAALLYTREFYQICRGRLKPGGVLAVQAEAADISDFAAHVSVVKTLESVFPAVLPYAASIPSYGSVWGFAAAGEADLPDRLTAAAVEHVLHARQLTGLRYYDGETHRHLFALPRFLRAALADPESGDVISDERPLQVA